MRATSFRLDGPPSHRAGTSLSHCVLSCAHLCVCRFAVQHKAVTVRHYRHAECLADCDAVRYVTIDAACFGAYCFLLHQGRTVSFPEMGASTQHLLPAGHEMVPAVSLQLVLATVEALRFSICLLSSASLCPSLAFFSSAATLVAVYRRHS